MYCAPIFRNTLAIQLLSAFSSDPEHKYLTSGTQQRFKPAPGACIVHNHIDPSQRTYQTPDGSHYLNK